MVIIETFRKFTLPHVVWYLQCKVSILFYSAKESHHNKNSLNFSVCKLFLLYFACAMFLTIASAHQTYRRTCISSEHTYITVM